VREEEAVTSQHILSFSSAASAAAPIGVAEGEPLDSIDGIVGRSSALREVIQRVQRVAPTDTAVLITGETGTGKELLARAIHRRSRRAVRHLVSANLAAVPESLTAAELFGHEKGAFTGADRLRIGRFEAADHGTLFLDEIGELPVDAQVLLLRVLQEGQFERLGSATARHADVRLIAATNRDLELSVQEGRFREDLFYRLSVFPLHLPPLRERPDDIPALADYFLKLAGQKLGRRFTGIARNSLRRLEQHPWPGNIRQLQNVIEQSAIMCDDNELEIPDNALSGLCNGKRPDVAHQAMFSGKPTLEEVKKRYIGQLLRETGGNIARAAAILDVNRRSLYRIVARYDLGEPNEHRQMGTAGADDDHDSDLT
jgi:formate hydrogenlyase transcriptional activator